MATQQSGPAQILPGKALGLFGKKLLWSSNIMLTAIALGASLHHVLTRVKARPQSYPSIELSYSAAEPVRYPVVLNLPSNGIRLRFDGPDQRLRLIEVLDFSKNNLSYKGIDLVRRPRGSSDTQDEIISKTPGPQFKHVYNRIFGPSYAGEYLPPHPGSGDTYGTYVLSYPGVALCFPLLHSAWSDRADFVSLLSSSASLPATSMALFQGVSWVEVRATLFSKQPQFPRLPIAAGKNKDAAPDEVEGAEVYGQGQVLFLRRTLPSSLVTLGETTPQDLIAEFGPPDAIYRKSDTRISIHGNTVEHDPTRLDVVSPMDEPRSVGSDVSAVSYGDETEAESHAEPGNKSQVNEECFFNYFHHGFDAFVSLPTTPSPPFPGHDARPVPSTTGLELKVTKILLHGNVPGSYSFNRHRRSRWLIDTGVQQDMMDSEMSFAAVAERLKTIWHGRYKSMDEERAMQRPMVLNRGWGESPESSVEIVGGWEDSVSGHADGESGPAQSLGNTELVGFPGLLFEVMKNGSISCLTVY